MDQTGRSCSDSVPLVATATQQPPPVTVPPQVSTRPDPLVLIQGSITRPSSSSPHQATIAVETSPRQQHSLPGSSGGGQLARDLSQLE